tara:strand:+ start:2321 stop:2878 length:558 start_codon:yes stop_codon:yes gene_type:complete
MSYIKNTPEYYKRFAKKFGLGQESIERGIRKQMRTSFTRGGFGDPYIYSKSGRRAGIAKEVADAMNPDGPVNPTRRGSRIASNIGKAQGRAATRAAIKTSLRASAGVAAPAVLATIGIEGIYKGTKRALGPGGKEFHTAKGPHYTYKHDQRRDLGQSSYPKYIPGNVSPSLGLTGTATRGKEYSG